MSQFDQDCITYTQQGRILQIEYATKAVQVAQQIIKQFFRTIIGVKCKDGVILGAQKQILSKLLVQKTNRRIFNVDKHLGMAICGKIPDGRHMMNYARNQSNKFFKDYYVPVSGKTLSDRLSLYLNAYTLYNSVRPFGSAEIIASYTKEDGFGLYMLEPSGVYYGYSCCTAGKGRQTAKAQFQKTDFSKLTCEQALFYIAKIQKKYQIEISWICEKSGFAHQMVPDRLIQDAVKRAQASIEQEQMG